MTSSLSTQQSDSEPLRLAVLVGSTRPGRRSYLVAEWAAHLARDALAGRAEVSIIDIAEFDLPLLDEPQPAAIGDYRHDHTRRWADAIAAADGFIIVTPEYNHSLTPALKNAIDFLYAEWHDKAAGFVSFGLSGGVRAVEHLRLTLAEVKVACVRSQVALDLFTDFAFDDISEPGTVQPGERHVRLFERMLDELLQWSAALRPLRVAVPA